ncbi:MAG: YwiC-like family protein [Anaerolineales bacterium]
MSSRKIWRKHYALPAEHGAWIWWIGPLLIGTAAGGKPGPLLGLLGLTALPAFLLRQPAPLAVKALSGRRTRDELRPALIWSAIYTGLALLGVALLVGAGQGRLLLLAIPGWLIFSWHLWLVSRRQERQRPGVEILAAGALALTAPAAYWVSGGGSDREAWILWGLTWLQSAASIVHVHVRLEQRHLEHVPEVRERLQMGRRSLMYNGFNQLAGLGLAFAGWVPSLVPVAFGVTFLDALEGILHPAVGAQPRRIGVRQLLISTVFVLLMALTYLL